MSFGKSKRDELFEIQANTLIDFYALQGPVRHRYPRVFLGDDVYFGDPSYLEQVAFSPNGKLLASAPCGGTISLWSVEERKRKHILEGLGSDSIITFLRDSTLVECEKDSGLARVWDTETGEVKNGIEFPIRKRSLTTLDCSPDGSLVAAALENDSIELRDTEKGEIKHVFPCTWKSRSHRIKLSSNGEVMAVVHSTGCTILRNTGKGFQEHMISDDPSSRVLFSPNNQVMALANREGIFFGDKAWFGDKHGQASKCISEFSLESSWPIVFSRDGKLAAFVIPYSGITLCNTGQGEEMRVLKGHSAWLMSLAFSPISPLLASASSDTVTLWDTEKGERLCTLIAHSHRVTRVAFSPNGELVATASSHGEVGLWNVSRWKNGKDQE